MYVPCTYVIRIMNLEPSTMLLPLHKMARIFGAVRGVITPSAQRNTFLLWRRRTYHCSAATLSRYNQPLSGFDMPRSGGIATVFRLPLIQDSKYDGLDACFIGIPMDHGTSNRSGTRLGPRAIRNESVMIRAVHMNGASPFDSIQVADIGDVPIVPYNLPRSTDIITDFYHNVLKAGPVPLTLGGDHTLTWPVLRAIREHHGRPVGLVHIDAHTDLHDEMNGEKIAHGTPFRRALEEELVDPKFMVQIGIRGSIYGMEDIKENFEWAQQKGARIVLVEQCWHKSLAPLMNAVRKEFKDIPTYISFDIDAIDPGCCPGTGTPEMGGLTPVQALEIVRGCKGLNVIGGDLVEVNPLYDQSGATALMAANLLFEMLCVLPGVKYQDFSVANKNTFHF